jgi:sec-independent protein translocase protein TatA
MFEGLFAPTHLIIILVIALIVLGPKRLPEAGRSLGAAMRGFKDSLGSADEPDDPPAIEDKPARKPPT